ncbi:MAG: periplasmic heavy metal sensor [Hyphomicrobium sp.]
MTTETGAVAQDRSRWLKIGLIASLALNLLFIGGFARAFWHHGPGPGGHFGKDAGLMGFVRELPGDRQKLVRDDIAAARETIRPLRRAVREAWSEANTALTAEPFNKDTYKAAVDKLTEAEARMKAATATALADTAAKLTAEERRSLQGWREKRKPHMFRRHGHRDGTGRDDKGPGADDQD